MPQRLRQQAYPPRQARRSQARAETARGRVPLLGRTDRWARRVYSAGSAFMLYNGDGSRSRRHSQDPRLPLGFLLSLPAQSPSDGSTDLATFKSAVEGM